MKRLHQQFDQFSVEKLYILDRAQFGNVDKKREKYWTRSFVLVVHVNFKVRSRDVSSSLFMPTRISTALCASMYFTLIEIQFSCRGREYDYQAGRWLRKLSAEALWRALSLYWIDVYLAPSDVIAHNAEKKVKAKVLKVNADLIHVKATPVPVESPNSMTIVKRYHDPLRRAYRNFRDEAPSLHKEAVLQAAVQSVNDSTGLDGLVLTLLVYEALPRLGLPNDLPKALMSERAAAVQKTTLDVSKYFAKRQVSDALRTRN